MVFRGERHKRLPCTWISRLVGFHSHGIETLSNFHIFGKACSWTNGGISQCFLKSTNCFPTEYISSPAAVVPSECFEVSSKEMRFVGIHFRHQMSEIFDDNIRIVVCFHEPVSIVEVMSINIIPSSAGFRPQVLAPFLNIESDCGELWVRFRAHKQKNIAALPPSLLNWFAFDVQSFRARHYPA